MNRDDLDRLFPKNHAFYEACSTGSYYAPHAIEAVRVSRTMKARAKKLELSTIAQGTLWVELAQYRTFLMTGLTPGQRVKDWKLRPTRYRPGKTCEGEANRCE